MFGLSLGKLLVLIAIIVVVWYGFKYVARTEEVRRHESRRKAPAAGPKRVEAEDMTKCSVCGAYVAARGAAHCGRSDCPW
jgi:uncharacterized protein